MLVKLLNTYVMLLLLSRTALYFFIISSVHSYLEESIKKVLSNF